MAAGCSADRRNVTYKLTQPSNFSAPASTDYGLDGLENNSYFAPGRVQSIAISVFVCLSAVISHKPPCPNFTTEQEPASVVLKPVYDGYGTLYLLSVTVGGRFFCDDNAVRVCRTPVLVNLIYQVNWQQTRKRINTTNKKEKKKHVMSTLPHVTHSQHERTVDIIRCQTERIWP